MRTFYENKDLATPQEPRRSLRPVSRRATKPTKRQARPVAKKGGRHERG